MALKKVDFAPGFNKQSVPSALPGQWVDGDFVRFRYTAPEKIGGWEQLTAASKTLPGAARAQLTWTSLAGERYAAIVLLKVCFYIMVMIFLILRR